MEINATLFGQMITFAIFVWFTMRFVWPLLEKTLKDRQDKISEGLLAAERGHKELEIAQKSAIKQIREARETAAHIVDQAHKQAYLIIEEAKATAHHERDTIVQQGRLEVEQTRREAQSKLQDEVGGLVVSITERLLKRQMNEADQAALLELKKAKTL